MFRKVVADIVPGMKVAKHVFTADGRVLLSTSMEIKEQYIERLKSLEIPSLYVQDESMGEIDVPEILSDRTRVEAIKSLKEVLTNFKTGKGLDMGKIVKIIDSIIDELVSTRKNLINISDIRIKSDYIYGHLVNVCVLSLLTGISMQYNQLRLRELGIGALLHDLGKFQVNNAILEKETNEQKLTAKEEEELQKHTNYGFEALRLQRGFSILCAHALYQHHERYDGKGYPRKLKGEEIHEYARIISIADLFDHLTVDMVGKNKLLHHEAIEELMAASESKFDPEIVKVFINNIAIYPVGSLVTLNTGEVAMVISSKKELPVRPIVRLINDPSQREIDLMKDLTVFITEVKQGN